MSVACTGAKPLRISKKNLQLIMFSIFILEAQCETEPRKVKKKRRRKVSKSKTEDGTTSEYTDEEEETPCDEETKATTTDGVERLQNEEAKIPLSVHEQNGCDETKCDESVMHCDKNDGETATTAPVPNEKQKFDLKPDAEEFIPKALREPPPIDPNIQFVNFQPNFVPIPIMGDIPPPQYPPPFLPPGIPINFVPPNAKIVPNFVNFVPNFVPKTYPVVTADESQVEEVEQKSDEGNVESKQHFVTPNEVPAAKAQKIPNKTDIDIEKIVSKLEEAAMEQRMNENKRQSYSKFGNKSRYQQNGGYQQKKRKEGEEKFSKPRNSFYKKEAVETSEPSTPKKAQNYSTTVRLAQKCPRYERHQQQQQQEKPQECPRYERHQENPQGRIETPPAKPAAPTQSKKQVATQWISVASRKKRKNKGANENEEVEDVFLEEEVEAKLEEGDGFESYDVTQLVDVVPALVEEVKIEEDNSNIPKEAVIADEGSVVVEEPVKVLEEEEAKNSRKGRKNSQKSATKRIIIKDTYEVAPEVSKKPLEATAKPQTEEVEEPQPKPEPLTAITESPISTPEKRTKKKKKKPQKPTVTKSVSVSSSNTTLNNLDDTYDFLLEPSVLDESEDKTNVEISQELDRLIQKGMYNNLEEKIKSLNTSFPSDNFFSSINLTSPLTFEKSNFLKSNEFNSLFTTTTNLLARPKRYDNDDFGKFDIDFSKIKLPIAEPQPSTSKAGIFLENPEVNEILKDTGNEVPKLEVPVATKKCKSNGKLKNKSKKSLEEVEVEGKRSSCDLEDKTKLYPITQAVKEWMTKTRENTPEVEILKSPKTIKKELGEIGEAEGKVEEEVVLFSMEEEDLLDCWQNDVKAEEVVGNGVEEAPKLANGTKNEEEEEAIEIYESKYGKNEDFLKLQAEIEEKKRKLQGNFPKHGNLPYRAICCSIM